MLIIINSFPYSLYFRGCHSFSPSKENNILVSRGFILETRLVLVVAVGPTLDRSSRTPIIHLETSHPGLGGGIAMMAVTWSSGT